MYACTYVASVHRILTVLIPAEFTNGSIIIIIVTINYAILMSLSIRMVIIDVMMM